MTDVATHSAGDDIRLLGRLLGDVVRKQAGDDAFELIERVRQVAVTERRDGPGAVRRSGRRAANGVAGDRLHVIRAFALAVAAGRHRGGRARRAASPVPSRQWLGRSHRHAARHVPAAARRWRSPPTWWPACSRELKVSPVLTAHPTEVRRKTVLEHVARVADLLDAAPRRRPTCRCVDAQLRLEVLMLWQTAILRLSKLRVARRDQRVAALLRAPACSTSRPRCDVAVAAEFRRVYGVEPEVGPTWSPWGRGSAATATAIRSSPPTRCATPPRVRPNVALGASPRSRCSSCR